MSKTELNNRISEETISTQYEFSSDMGQQYFGVLIDFKVKTNEYPDWKKEAEKTGNEIRQQILNNEAIVEKLKEEIDSKKFYEVACCEGETCTVTEQTMDLLKEILSTTYHSGSQS